MTIENGRFDPEEKEQILDQLIAGAEVAFGQELDPDSASVIRAFYDPIAEYLASQQTDIRETLDAAQIDHAEGESLDLLAALIGVVRREATEATTRLEFSSDDQITRGYTIPSGTRVQTDAVDAINFETDYATELKYLEDFEDNDLTNYGGDNAVFTSQSTTVYQGSYALEGDATASGTIVDAGMTVERGSVNTWRQHLDAGAVAGVCWGAENTDNHYRIVLDDSAGEVRAEVLEDGTASTIDSPLSATLPTGEWLQVEFDWENGEDMHVTVTDAGGSEVVSGTFTQTQATYEDGGIGFYDGSASATARWDILRMEAVSVDATAVEAGTQGNVGAGSLTVFSDRPTGIDDVTNPIPANGGLDREPDDDFRNRVKEQLSEGMRATLPALINGLQRLRGTRSVSVIVNDNSTDDSDGRPPHSFEAIVDADSDVYDDIAERILDRKAAGDIPVGGYDGDKITRTVELVNGQEKDISFSIPTQIKIYADIDLEKTSTYAGDAQVRDSIVQYIGGTLNSLDEVGGELEVNDNVIYYQIVEAIMDVEGVYNITNLEVGTTSSPTGTSDIAIGSNEAAVADATDNSLDITSNNV